MNIRNSIEINAMKGMTCTAAILKPKKTPIESNWRKMNGLITMFWRG
tara:strand:+ start:271 stop:411 length:141 start_codon:yes stop_codon:yes gene_type:complete